MKQSLIGAGISWLLASGCSGEGTNPGTTGPNPGTLQVRDDVSAYHFGHSLVSFPLVRSPLLEPARADIPNFMCMFATDNGQRCETDLQDQAGAPLRVFNDYWVDGVDDGGWDPTPAPLAGHNVFVLTDANYVMGDFDAGGTFVIDPDYNEVDTEPGNTIQSSLHYLVSFANHLRSVEPDADIYLYAHWPGLFSDENERQYCLSIHPDSGVCDAPSVPGDLSRADFDALFERFRNTVGGTYQSWWERMVDGANGLERYPTVDGVSAQTLEGASIKLIPVGSIVFDIFALPEYDSFPVETVFYDMAHGETLIYYFAGLTHYMAIFGQVPDDLTAPATVDLSQDQLDAATNHIWNRLNTYPRAR